MNVGIMGIFRVKGKKDVIVEVMSMVRGEIVVLSEWKCG